MFWGALSAAALRVWDLGLLENADGLPWMMLLGTPGPDMRIWDLGLLEK